MCSNNVNKISFLVHLFAEFSFIVTEILPFIIGGVLSRSWAYAGSVWTAAYFCVLCCDCVGLKTQMDAEFEFWAEVRPLVPLPHSPYLFLLIGEGLPANELLLYHLITLIIDPLRSVAPHASLLNIRMYRVVTVSTRAKAALRFLARRCHPGGRPWLRGRAVEVPLGTVLNLEWVLSSYITGSAPSVSFTMSHTFKVHD